MPRRPPVFPPPAGYFVRARLPKDPYAPRCRLDL